MRRLPLTLALRAVTALTVGTAARAARDGAGPTDCPMAGGVGHGGGLFHDRHHR